MNVYVVETGENGAGGRAIGVYTTRKAAEAAALRFPYCFEQWEGPDGEGLWWSGCDFVRVREFEVKGA